MDALVARQPIFDRQRNLYGYELLYRQSATSDAFDGTDSGEATMHVLSNMLMSIRSEDLVSGKKAFINFDHRLLASHMYLNFPRESIVVELLETVEPTADLIALCQGIALEGYTLALDDFTDGPDFEPLTRIAGVIKVDLRVTSQPEQERLLRIHKPRGVLMLAEKVETYMEFERARHAGYDLFQGYFFARPMTIKNTQVPTTITACLQLLQQLRSVTLDFRRFDEIIREDVSLTYKLLRYTNSAMFQRNARIDSIPAALLHLGEDNVRRWVSLATLPTLAAEKPSELVKLSLMRARFCEELAALTKMKNPNEAYLMGLFSLLDALLDRPLEEALCDLDLGVTVTDALLGVSENDEPFKRLYQLARHYEAGNWDEVQRMSKVCGIEVSAVGNAYIDSTVKAEQLQSFEI